MKLRTPIIAAAVLITGLGLGYAQKDKLTDPELMDPTAWKTALGASDGPEGNSMGNGLLIMERTAQKDAVAQKLIAGEINLPEAAAKFVTINSQIKSYFVGLDCNYPGMDRKEAVYRNILAWVESLCGKQPNYNVIQERLQADFEECRKDGFPLPPIPLRAQAAND